jgi:nitroreductase
MAVCAALRPHIGAFSRRCLLSHSAPPSNAASLNKTTKGTSNPLDGGDNFILNHLRSTLNHVGLEIMTTRRSVLSLLAVAPLVPVLGSCTSADLPDPIAAWRAPGAGEVDPRRHALAHAILAPNPHNRQPWLVELVGEQEIVLRADLDRLLPATDPYDRQIVLGCGAFIEMLDLAARANGHRTEISTWPEGEPQPRLDTRPIAHIRLIEEPIARDVLFDQILVRRTNREPYELRDVSPASLDALRMSTGGGVVFGSATGGEMREALRELAWRGFDTETHTPTAYQESVDLMRIGKVEIATNRDGLAMDGAMIEFANALGLLNRRTLADVDNAFVKQGIEAFRPLALEAPAYVWINTPDNTRTTQIAAGRAYARMNLAATGVGLSMHPWSQALQEYPEMASLHAQAEELLNAAGDARVQMLSRVGYGPQVAPSPRRGLAEHIRT